MLFSIITNLITLYNLITWPIAGQAIIDVSQFQDSGKVQLIKSYHQQAPIKKNQTSLGVEISAESAIIVDQNSQAVLWQKNPDFKRSIASLTKLMTVWVFLKNNPDFEKTLIIQSSDYRNGGKRNLFTGEEITIKDLFNLTLVASDNTAAAALVRAIGLTEEQFVKSMNEQAKQLGMLNTEFFEPTGLDVKNQSTVSDLAKLINQIFDQAVVKEATVQKNYTFQVVNNQKIRQVENTNLLLNSYLEIIAGKTGHLDEAGYCLSGLVKGDQNQEIYIVLLGSQSHYSRFQEFKALAQWAFDNFSWPASRN